MAEAYGNILDPPGFKTVTEVKPGDILYSMAVGILKKGMTIKTGQGLIVAGTVMAYETATKKYVKYNDAGAGGAEVADGILGESVDTSLGDKLGNIYFAGAFKLSKVIGYNAAAGVDLNARTDTDRDFLKF